MNGLPRQIISSFLLLIAASTDAAAETPRIHFDRDVKPIFAKHCVSCHGEKKQVSGFRLDRKTDAMKGGDSGVAIVPGSSEKSPLYRFAAGLEPDLLMPPKEKKDQLLKDELGILKAWIDQGADWPETAQAPTAKHWAFDAPKRPVPPRSRDLKRNAWAANAIDAFVMERLEREGLRPSPEADRITLIRRLYLDLIGLPPTPKLVDAFVKDASPGAYERVVEELLASPHYGERWGRHWLDAARYADSDGYEKDKSRQIWFYRDWVVDAINRDLPYDRFLIEQIAGDLLPNATQEQIVATGFLRNSMLNEEGGVDPEQFRMDAMFDRMDAIGRSMLGLSIACAQCHNHKYDPLTQEEYYRMFACLNNDHEAQSVVYTKAEQTTIKALQEAIQRHEKELQENQPTWKEKLAKWEASVRDDQPKWNVLTIANEGDNGQRYIPQNDGSLLAQGYAPTKHSTLLKAASPVRRVTALRLELLNDPNLPCNGPGRSVMGTCALTEFKVEVDDLASPGKRKSVRIARASADYANPERPLEKTYDDRSNKPRVTGPVSFAIDGKDETAWGIDAGPGRRNVPRVAVFIPEEPLDVREGANLHVTLKQAHGGWNSDDNMNNNLGRFRLSVTDARGAIAADPIPASVRQLLAIPADKRSATQVREIFSHWRTTVPEFQEANEAIEALWQRWPEGATTLVMQARSEPRPTHILKRGDFLKPTRVVEPGVPGFLHMMPTSAKPPRLAFAEWIASAKSPTTARAFVNRVWQAYFGQGLVATPEEFGTQGERPSHPELLDWVACEFMEPTAGEAGTPWSLKRLHRLIVTSATYRQSSRITPELLAKDPYNRLLARGPRLRVEGEIVRDLALAASGLLNRKVGGPSVFAPAPAFLFQPPSSYGPFDWAEATNEDRYRRSVYTFRRRSTPYPALATFDTPVGEQACVRRTRTNTPLQALTALNETLFVEAGRALGRRAILEGGETDAGRITHIVRLCVSRSPSNDELQLLTALLAKQRARLTTDEPRAIEIATGEKKLAGNEDGISPAEWAAFTLVARVILNLDETITKE